MRKLVEGNYIDNLIRAQRERDRILDNGNVIKVIHIKRPHLSRLALVRLLNEKAVKNTWINYKSNLSTFASLKDILTYCTISKDTNSKECLFNLSNIPGSLVQ